MDHTSTMMAVKDYIEGEHIATFALKNPDPASDGGLIEETCDKDGLKINVYRGFVDTTPDTPVPHFDPCDIALSFEESKSGQFQIRVYVDKKDMNELSHHLGEFAESAKTVGFKAVLKKRRLWFLTNYFCIDFSGNISQEQLAWLKTVLLIMGMQTKHKSALDSEAYRREKIEKAVMIHQNFKQSPCVIL